MPLIKYNNQSLSSITAIPASIPTGKLKLISSQTASNSASISFTSGLNSTYKVYRFVFVNIHPRTNNVWFYFNLSTDGGTNYNVTKTSTFFKASQREDASLTALDYRTGEDLAQSTAYQSFQTSDTLGNASDDSCACTLTLFNPASTTYVKHFIATSIYTTQSSPAFCMNSYIAGYANTTSAVNAINFKMDSGNFDGTIYLYAIDNS